MFGYDKRCTVPFHIDGVLRGPVQVERTATRLFFVPLRDPEMGGAAQVGPAMTQPRIIAGTRFLRVVRDVEALLAAAREEEAATKRKYSVSDGVASLYDFSILLD